MISDLGFPLTADTDSMGLSLGKFVDRWSRTAIVSCVVYSCVCTTVMLSGLGGPGAADLIGAWGAFPLIFIFTVMLWPVIHDSSLSRARRLAFRLIFAAEVLDVVATVGWG